MEGADAAEAEDSDTHAVLLLGLCRVLVEAAGARPVPLGHRPGAASARPARTYGAPRTQVRAKAVPAHRPPPWTRPARRGPAILVSTNPSNKQRPVLPSAIQVVTPYDVPAG
ncbi:hypothetical protein GCM10018980_34350 [Streptomyces capoamus]|uniref:Uncharacterized protein n=1 Tax=Streptomyces capoamus TaxID=68183 RepID=A0A919C7A6_9ACTN|nr:hypothetical protein GCM10010501_04980 [Streptomyces libani subsp. rufus]GHG51595.1 hypothetical protein GCM10018980_34350 [Streptomyces capoamus]